MPAIMQIDAHNMTPIPDIGIGEDTLPTMFPVIVVVLDIITKNPVMTMKAAATLS